MDLYTLLVPVTMYGLNGGRREFGVGELVTRTGRAGTCSPERIGQPHRHKWGERHARAWSDALLFARSGANAQYPSRCIVPMIVGWVRYADSHRARYEGGVAECGVMGPAWEQIGRALKTMLNGELDALDAGTLDQIIGSVLLNEGFGDE